MRRNRSFTSSPPAAGDSPQGQTPAAVMSIDIAGAGTSTGKRKDLTPEGLEEHRSLVRLVLPRYNGREIGRADQGFCVEFTSVLEAVRCAVEIQRAVTERKGSSPSERSIDVRIGVHLGLITSPEKQTSSNAFDIATRIAGLTPRGGICLSEEAARVIRDQFELPLLRLGEDQLKNSDLPFEVYRVALPWGRYRGTTRRVKVKGMAGDLSSEHTTSTGHIPDDAWTTALLKAKLRVPFSRTGVVPRPRLIERLNNGLTCKLTLLAAPAGFGKTTLLTDWIRQTGRRVSWLSLDEHDNSLPRFWTYIIGALQTLQPHLGESSAALLAAHLQQSKRVRHESFLTPLINELGAVKDGIALVLDDYHFITDPLVHEGLTFFLDHLPPQMHVIISSRADPPLPLSRLRARNQLNELRAEDLRFTSEEAEAFLNQVMGLHLSAGSIFALETRTEGWIVGLQFAALSVQRLDPKHQRSFIRKFAGSHHYVVDYLAEEVFNTQPESVKRFLLLTSILDRLSGSLCDAVTGGNDGESMLASLERNNLFTVPLDEQGQWYRYHQLFADVLRHRLEHEQPMQVPDLHRRASAWFEQRGSVPEAMHHALAARDFDSATRLLEGVAGPMIKQGETGTLLVWLDSLPVEVVRSRPRLSLAKAWAVVSQDRMQEAAAYLSDAERWAMQKDSSHPDVRTIRGEAAAVRAMMGVMLDDAPAILDAATKALEYLPFEQKYLRGLVTMNVSVAHMLLGDFPEARRAGDEALRIGHETGNRTLQYYAYFCLAGIERIHANLPRAADNLRKALEAAQTPGGAYLPIATLAHRYLAETLYEWNDLGAAHRHINLALELGESWWVKDEMIKSYMLLARIEKAKGNADAVRDALKQAEEITDDRYAFNLLTQIGLPSIKEWEADGFLQPAFRWGEKGLRNQQPEPSTTIHQSSALASLARLSLTQGNSTTALELLASLLPTVEKKELTSMVIEGLVLQALALQAREDIPAALECLNRALSLARPAGYVRMFLDEGEAMQSLLHRVTGANRRYAATLVYARDPRGHQGAVSKEHTETSMTSGSTLIEPLSRRELEVIPLLAEGLSNLEVARRLHISMDTVKVHLRHIYQKLGVNNRSQATIRARELSLL